MGYRLDFRHTADDEYDSSTNARKSFRQLLDDVLDHFEIEKLLGGGLGFFRLEAGSITTQELGDLPKERFVFEIPALKEVGAELIQWCKEMRRQGIGVALADYERRDPRECLLDFVGYVKIDPANISAPMLRSVARSARRAGKPLIAEGIDTPEQRDAMFRVGVTHFQGTFFANLPKKLDSSLAGIDSDRAVVLSLLNTLQGDVDVTELEEIFKRNAKLGVNLLRIVNSLGYGRSERISSVNQALMTVGIRGLSRWLSLMVYAGGDEGPASQLLTLAATRSRMLELLQIELNRAEGLGVDEGRTKSDAAFLTGLVSLFPVLLNVSLEAVLEKVPLEDSIEKALCGGQDELGMLLQIVKCVETGDLEAVAALIEQIPLSRNQLQQALVHSAEWVADL